MEPAATPGFGPDNKKSRIEEKDPQHQALYIMMMRALHISVTNSLYMQELLSVLAERGIVNLTTLEEGVQKRGSGVVEAIEKMQNDMEIELDATLGKQVEEERSQPSQEEQSEQD